MLNIVSAHSPRFSEHNGITLFVTFSGIGEVPFHAHPDDPESHGRELYTRALDGEFGAVEPYNPPVTPLGDIYAAKMEAINIGKNTALDGGFTYGGTLYDSDSKARLAYLELATKLGQDQAYATPWKASRGQWVTMDAALFADLQPAYEAHIQACFAWQAEREQEVAEAMALEDEDEARAALAAIPESM